LSGQLWILNVKLTSALSKGGFEVVGVSEDIYVSPTLSNYLKIPE